MKQKKKGLSFVSYIFMFLLMAIISLIILVWGWSTYEKPEAEPEIVVEEQEEAEPDDELQVETDLEDSDVDLEEGDALEETEPKIEETLEEAVEETQEELEENTDTESETVAEDDAYGRRMYQQLNEEEQGIYKIVQKTLQNMETTCTIEKVMGDDAQIKDTVVRAIDAVYFDYPEYFWFNHASQWQYWAFDGYAKVELTLDTYDYWEYVLNKDGYVDAVNQKAQEIANQARGYDSTYDKVKFVHDYLVTHAVYDDVAYEERTQSVQKASSQQSHTVYGCLVNQSCVCDGYAKTFQLIMNLLGIACEYVEGYAGELHAWNYILLDGEHYWMDVTWDDYNQRDENGELMYPNGVDYDYFCITSDTLYDTHTPEATFELPVCDATDYNFFYRENSYLETYSFDAFAKGVEEQKDAQIISIKFGSKDAMDQSEQDLFLVNKKYLELPYIGEKQGAYLCDELRNVLKIYYR